MSRTVAAWSRRSPSCSQYTVTLDMGYCVWVVWKLAMTTARAPPASGAAKICTGASGGSG